MGTTVRKGNLCRLVYATTNSWKDKKKKKNKQEVFTLNMHQVNLSENDEARIRKWLETLWQIIFLR